mmetsp:Transcript_24201/g.57995  ORF Transcript_24201/g.57995 Transcript_24201/m.57995 type:complete len:203 (+) Transcript_24201:633-1241(+)
MAQAMLPVLHGGGGAGGDRGDVQNRPRGGRGAEDLDRGAQRAQDGLGHVVTGASVPVGRGEVGPRVRPRAVQRRRGRRLQHGRHGEQVAQRLQLPPRPRHPGDGHRLLVRVDPGHHRPRVLPQLDRQPGYPQLVVPPHAQGGPHGLQGPGVHLGSQLPQRQAHRRRPIRAREPVCRGRGGALPPDQASLLRKDGQLLHQHGV